MMEFFKLQNALATIVFILFNFVSIVDSFTISGSPGITITTTTAKTRISTSTSTPKHATSMLSSATSTQLWSMNNKNNNNNNNVSTTSTTPKSKISIDNIKNKNILVIGGSGRVGGSVACNLLLHGANVTIGGTNEQSYLTSKERWMTLYKELSFLSSDNGGDNDNDKCSFVQLDRENVQSVSNAIHKSSSSSSSSSTKKYDLIVHTAGPFQGKVNTPNGVIEAAIQNSIPYIDVCDDYCTAKAAQTKYNNDAINNNVPCILSTGCWPGVSSLMAKQLTSNVLSKNPKLKPQDLKVDYSFFTAGSGGAGSTLLVATFLILAEKSLMIVNGRRKEVDSMKEYKSINFGPIVGDKDVAHLNLLETASIHDVLGIGNVETLFGTAPGFWNTLLGVMAQLPSSLLSNEPIMEKLALFSLPIVRVVDYFAGATNAMRCDVSCDIDDNVREMALYAHENLEPCVGECVVGFCAALLADGTDVVDCGVHFPEEAIGSGDDAAAVLQLASVGAHTLEVESSSGLTKEEVWGVVA